MRKRANPSRAIFTKHFRVYYPRFPWNRNFGDQSKIAINDALITVRLLFAKLDSRRNRAVLFRPLRHFSAHRHFTSDDERRKGRGGGIYVRIEGNKRSSLFRALDIFLYDRSCVFCERTLARFLDAAFRKKDAENDGGGRGEKNPPCGGGIRNRMWS